MKTYIQDSRQVEEILAKHNIVSNFEKMLGENLRVTKDSLDTLDEKLTEEEFATIVDNTYLGVYKDHYVKDGYLIEG